MTVTLSILGRGTRREGGIANVGAVEGSPGRDHALGPSFLELHRFRRWRAGLLRRPSLHAGLAVNDERGGARRPKRRSSIVDRCAAACGPADGQSRPSDPSRKLS